MAIRKVEFVEFFKGGLAFRGNAIDSMTYVELAESINSCQ